MNSINRLHYTVVIVLLTACIANASILFVDNITGQGHFNSINLAHNDAANGDTILVTSGSYLENLTVTKKLIMLGVGMDQVSFNGMLTLSTGSSGSIFSGLNFNFNVPNVSGSSLITINSGIDGITFKGCRIIDTANYGHPPSPRSCILRVGSGLNCTLSILGCNIQNNQTYYYNENYRQSDLIKPNGENLIISNSLFSSAVVSNYRFGNCIDGMVGSQLVIQNCIMIGFSELFNISGSPAFLFYNNIMYNWGVNPTFGVMPTAGTINYNASSILVPPGTNGILLNSNPFISYNQAGNYQWNNSDVHLISNSPCIDGGNPVLLDIDGSPSDMGIYGGPNPYTDSGAPNYPFVGSTTIPPAITVGNSLPVRAIGRIGRNY